MFRPSRNVLAFCLFCSGFTAMVFEVLWMKALGLLFGNTAQSAAMTLAVFFGGLCAGGIFWGRRSESARNPVRLYAMLEAFVALAALSYFLLLPLYSSVYPPLARACGNNAALLLALKTLLAAPVVLLPAFFMGGTLPALAQAMARTPRDTGVAASLLYATNTTGAVAGTFCAGFVLPPWLGYRASFILAVAINLLIAVVLFRASSSENAQQALPESGQTPDATPQMGSATVALLAFSSGALMLALEVFGVRMFSLVLQNSVYTFALILAVFLLALAAGGFCANRLLRWRWPAGAVIAVLLLLASLSIAAAPLIFYRYTGSLDYMASPGGFAGYLGRVALLAIPVIFIPAAIGGVLFPYLFGMRSEVAPGRGVGSLTALNNVGAATGSLIAGFVALPSVGLWSGVHWLAMLYAVLGIVVVWGAGGTRAFRVCGGFAAAFIIALTQWQHRPLPTVQLGVDEELIGAWEGSAGSVAVVRDGDDLQLRLDNSYTLGSSDKAPREQWQMDLPLLLHENPKSVCMIGLATGITPGAALSHSIERLDVCELIPEVATASREHFGALTNGLFDDKRVRVILDDGRHHLATTAQRYDVIVSDLFLPWNAGTGSLYSREHFQLCRERLAARGLLAQWLPLYQLSREEFGIITRTFLDVFPHATLWRANFSKKFPIVALIGSDSEFALNPEAIAARLGTLRPHRRWPAELEDNLLYACFAGNLAQCRELFAAHAINTDDRPLIEYLAPKTEAATAQRWFTGKALLEFHAELFQRAPPESDPCLSALTAEQHRAVRAGLEIASERRSISGSRY